MTRNTRNSVRKKTNIEEIEVSSEHQGPVFQALSVLLVSDRGKLARFIACNKLVRFASSRAWEIRVVKDMIEYLFLFLVVTLVSFHLTVSVSFLGIQNYRLFGPSLMVQNVRWY